MSRISVKVSTQSKKERVTFDEQNKLFKVWVSAKPVEGKANIRVLELLSEYFSVPKSTIKIFSGERANLKIIEIDKEIDINDFGSLRLL